MSGSLIAQSTTANNFNPGGARSVSLGGVRPAAFEAIIGYANTANGDVGWTPIQSWFAVESGSGKTSQPAYFPEGTGTPFNYMGSGRTTGAGGSGDSVSQAGAITSGGGVQEVGQKVGVSLTNTTGQPQQYTIRPRDAAGNAIPGMPDEVVELAPGQSWGKQYTRPSSSGGTGAFSVGVGLVQWVPDVEFGGTKQEEVPQGSTQSQPVVQPSTQTPTPPPTGSTGGATPVVNSPNPLPAPAANTQVSGTAAATASQQNSMTNNITAELQRLGGIVKAVGDTAHVDAVGTLNAIKAQSGAGVGDGDGGPEVDMSGVISAINQGTAATAAVGEGVGDLKEALTGDGDDPGELGEGIPEDDGAFLAGMGEMLTTLKTRFGILGEAIDDAFSTVLPGSSSRQSLDFQIPTPFGSINFNISQYDAWIQLCRDVILLVVSWQMLLSAIKMIRGAFADAN
ncbi:hypothetical protein [Verrucomicrobium sp. BvORR034]|uniref:hypothetical protein n=1 Tax=Verrucomicrobium sp. BvORR034 TaxID=1396418 RepID=UPI002241038D|nr:hypothetical protein [Verrucomicrobium sp. BvORR034]